jgi:hypothetical protein
VSTHARKLDARDVKIGSPDRGLEVQMSHPNRSGWVVLIAISCFLGGALATATGIFLTSLYEPVIRLTTESVHPRLTLLSTKNHGLSVIQVFRIDDPEMRNVGLKSGSLSKCSVAASGSGQKPSTVVTNFNRETIRPFETLNVRLFFRANFAPETRTAVTSWKVECYDNRGDFAFRLRVPSPMAGTS